MAFKAPKSFDFSEKQNWPEWRERWKRFYNLTKLSEKEGSMQVDALIFTMGEEAERQFRRFNFTEDQKKDYAHVLDTFDRYFTPQRNVVHERATFGRRSQREYETIHDYVQALYELSTHCQFHNKDEAIRDRLVLGVRDRDLSEKLQLEKDLTLDTAITVAKQREQVHKEISQQRGEDSEAKVDLATRSSFTGKRGVGLDRNKKTSSARASTKQSRGTTGNCTRCGGRHDKKPCPAKGQVCHKCKKLSHYARMCKSKLDVVNTVKTDNSTEDEGDSDSEGTFLLFDVKKNEADVPAWRSHIDVSGKTVLFKLDCGADVTVMNKKTWLKIGKPELKPSKVKLKGASDGQLGVLGMFEATLNQTLVTTVYVVQNDVENLLSRAASCHLNLLKRVETLQSDADVEFGELRCPPVKIKLKEDATPYSVNTARRVPIPMLKKVEEELQRLKDGGVIQEITEPTEWCSPMVPVVKSNGKIRICVDFKRLNKAVQRERFIIPTVEDVMHKLSGSTIFTKLDAASGFFQVPLDPETAKLTTFITPMGRYYFTHVPMGLSSAPEIFQRIMTEFLKDIPGVIVYFDDILCHSKCVTDHEKLVAQVKKRLQEVGLKLNPDKCEYSKPEIKFLGHIISGGGVRPDPEKIEAITKMEEPTNAQELRRLLGMVNFLAKYVPHLSTLLRPMSELLEKDRVWCWGPSQAEAFVRVKEAITSAPTLAFYDVTKPTTVSADASAYGIGGVLLQDHGGVMRPVAYCSRTLSPAEKRYAQIEKECLASVWACERFERYLVGLDDFIIETDHKPLVPLINSKDLSETPIRCQRMLIRLMRFKGHAQYTSGKLMHVADHLSRSPIHKEVHAVDLESEIAGYVHEVSSSWPVRDNRMEEIRQETQKDVNVKAAFDYTITGWPEYKEDVMLSAREFYGIRSELSVVDGLLVRGDRIVIPYSLRKEVLDRIHAGHLGINKCRERANAAVWWPNMSRDITDVVAKCRFCAERQPSHKSEPLLTSTLPERAFEKVGVDICEHKNCQFIVMVDYYSRYIDVARLPDLKTSSVIGKLKGFFAHHGIPNTVVSDNGPQFAAGEFKDFARKWGFNHVTSSPYFPQSNGAAERAVRTVKRILAQDDPFLALLIYRTTPIPELGASPAELAHGRQLRTTLPQLPLSLRPRSVDQERLRERDAAFKQRQKTAFDHHHGSRALSQLKPGDAVLVKRDGDKSWKQPAEVLGQCAPRSYIVQTPQGPLRRNRRHLRWSVCSSEGGAVPTSSPGEAVHRRQIPQQLSHGTTPQQSSPRTTMPVQPQVPTTVEGPLVSPSDSPPVSSPGPERAHSSPPLSTPSQQVTRSGRVIVPPSRFQD